MIANYSSRLARQRCFKQFFLRLPLITLYAGFFLFFFSRKKPCCRSMLIDNFFGSAKLVGSLNFLNSSSPLTIDFIYLLDSLMNRIEINFLVLLPATPPTPSLSLWRLCKNTKLITSVRVSSLTSHTIHDSFLL